MSCCGTPRDQAAPQNNALPDAKGTISSQPSPHPGAQYSEKQNYQVPTPLQAPPATYGGNGQPMGQPPAQQPWGGQSLQSPPPGAGQFNQYGLPFNGAPPTSQTPGFNPYGIPQSGSPPPNGFGVNGSHGVSHPESVYTIDRMASTSPPTTMTPGSRFGSMAMSAGMGAPADEGRMAVAIDFGTTFSGVAYGSSRIAAGKVQQILHWPGSSETFRKIPTCIVYSHTGQVLAWGVEAKNTSPAPGITKCEWFKLFLEPKALRDDTEIDPRLPHLPAGKQAVDVIVDFLSCLWSYAKDQITREIGAVADLDSANVWLTVPAAWDGKGCDLMRDAAIRAGLVQWSRAGDNDWRERLRIVTEPEAAAVHCAYMTELHNLRPSQSFMICDAGGGTVDLAAYKIIGQTSQLEIAEVCARSGANAGSIFLDLRFKTLLEALLAGHPGHLEAASMANFMNAFSEYEKAEFKGKEDDDNMFHFTCFNVLPDDPSVGLVNGELTIPGNLLRREVFDPVVNQVLRLIEDQSRQVGGRIDALLLVGGFAGSEYLFKRVQEQFGGQIKVIARPFDADTATLRGAARYGLEAGKNVVSSIIAPRSYLLKVKLPAEQEDWMKRPAYILENSTGVSVCSNRLQYLVMKGAILRKGQRTKTKFCKYSQNSQDCIFTAQLFVSDSDKMMRYTDEGETMELCKWTVDLGSLPTFQANAHTQAGGFYTEFEIGLELDSAEVRGILLYEGQEWGRVVFDFRS